MITVYRLDAQGVFASAIEIDPLGALPLPLSTVAPPATTGQQVAQWNGAEWIVLAERPPLPLPPPPTSDEVNAERDRRLGTTFAFAGKRYDCDQNSLARITGAATLAGFAMGAGAPIGFLRWHGAATDFAWIAADNTLTTMDAQTCFAFGRAAATNQSAHIFAGRAIKEMDPIPADYATNQSRWP